MNTTRQKATGTNGWGMPVLLSQTSVEGEVNCGTVINWREDEGDAFSAEIPGPQHGFLPSTPYQKLEVLLHESGIDNCVKVHR